MIAWIFEAFLPWLLAADKPLPTDIAVGTLPGKTASALFMVDWLECWDTVSVLRLYASGRTWTIPRTPSIDGQRYFSRN